MAPPYHHAFPENVSSERENRSVRDLYDRVPGEILPHGDGKDPGHPNSAKR
jgi:hypothetical protein